MTPDLNFYYATIGQIFVLCISEACNQHHPSRGTRKHPADTQRQPVPLQTLALCLNSKIALMKCELLKRI